MNTNLIASRRSISFMAGTILVAALAAVAQAGILTGAANGVLGQQVFTSSAAVNVSCNEHMFNQPYAVAIDTASNRLFVSDRANHRVLWWNNASSLSNDTGADGVLGQSNFSANSLNRGNGVAAPAQNNFNSPCGIAVDGAGKLWVADQNNSRVLCFDLAVSTCDAQIVLGQAGYAAYTAATTQTRLNKPTGVTVDRDGHVWVADSLNSRVLRYNSAALAVGAPADIVLGTVTFTASGAIDTSDTAVFQPKSVKVDAAGNVYVAELSNNRVVVFSAPISSGMASSIVLGQAGYGVKVAAITQAGMEEPYDVCLDTGGNVWVAMYRAASYNSRVVRYSLPLSSGMPADFVLGQPGFDSAGYNRAAIGQLTPLPVADGLFKPSGVTVDPAGRVWVADTFNNRVIRYDLSVSTHSAGLVLGQFDLTHREATRTNDSALYIPYSVAIDTASNRLFVADFTNHRVLWWNNPASFANGAAADGVLGQRYFGGNSANQGNGVSSDTLKGPAGVAVDPAGNVWVADNGNHRVLRFSGASLASGMPADLVLGQATFLAASSGTATATNLAFPTSVRIDREGYIWVADSAHHRVLRYGKKYSDNSIANNEPAALVLGQADMVSGLKNRDDGFTPSAGTLYKPTDIAFSPANAPWIVDSSNNRVLVFSSGTLTDGNNASYVIGQVAFNSASGSIGNTWVGDIWLNEPYGVAFDPQGNGWISDIQPSSHSRLMCFNPVTANGPQAVLALGRQLPGPVGQNSFLQPRGIFIDGQGSLWTADSYNNRLLKFTALSLSGAAPGTAAVADGTLSATLTGTDFVAGMDVRLERGGQAPIAASNVSVTSEAQLAATFSLAGAATGYWDIAVSTRGYSARISNAVLLTASSELNNTVRNIVTFTVGTVQVTLDIPGDAFSDTFNITCVPGTVTTGLTQTGLSASPIALDITNSKGLQPLRDITITIAYADADVAGMDESKLAIHYYDTARSRWIQIASTPDPANNRVTGIIKHLTSFRVFARIPLLTLDDAVAYPNPYKPSSGAGYDDSVLGRGVVFGNITENARIRIFTISGELVKDIAVAGSNGTCVWDTTNDSGEKTASGVFFYYITNPDDSSQKAKGKIAIIR